ncbi:MAG TPA: hypothetical protein VIC08_08000 [Cellvibrionaceae bacterium]
MATEYKVLGQTAPAATTNTDVYTVPAATEAIVSTIVVCNRAAAAGTFRIAVRPSGAAIADEHYIAFDVAISANDSTNLTIGVTVGSGDILTVYCSSASMSVSVFGSEIS